ncbi:MAG: TRC40/GET3/ArsA family transport-energizing ATPase [Candidatus Undinarchaeales archaeon]
MTEFILFGGKGGVGKTTTAAATALKLANDGNLTLIVSTDPAHSLSDSFEKKIGAEEKKLFENLWAIEINPEKEMEKFKEKLEAPKIETEETPDSPEFPGMPMRGGMPGLNPEQMMGGMADLGSMPGMDEMAAFDLFLKFLDTSEYDYVVFDTAPTGHTLKFLSLPELMDSWVGKMLKVKMQLSNAMDMFKKVLPFTEKNEKDGKKQALGNLEKMKKRIEKGKKALSDPKQTTFVLVTIPQEMAVSETERALEQLNEYKIPVEKIIINQIQPKNKDCSFCKERRKIQEKRLKELKDKFKNQTLIQVELFKKEIKGKKMLQKFSEKLK